MKRGGKLHNRILHSRLRMKGMLFGVRLSGSLFLCAMLLLLLLPKTARATGGQTAPKMTDPPANIQFVYHDVASGSGDISVRADGRMHIFYSSSSNRCDGRLIIAEASGSSKTKPVYISLNGVDMYRQQCPLAIPDNAYAQVWLNYINPRGYKGSSSLSGGSNSLFNVDYYGYAGLRVAEKAKFALRATDERCYQENYSLTVRGGVGAAGIGGHQNDNICGGGSWLDIDVSTTYYKLYVYGGTGGAGIGSGQDGWCDRLYISRGYIVAQGGQGGAGIGSGKDIGAGIGGECNGLTITGGHINATGGENAAGIGGGRDGNANAIWILGKTTYVEATGISGAAGIGGGDDGDGKNIVIEGTSAGGPTVYAYSSDNAAAIGGGAASVGSNITLRHCNVTAKAGGDGAGIGGGGTTSIDLTAAASNILIENAAVTAQSRGHGAGIGGGYAAVRNYPVNYITIKNSTVNAYAMGCGAGIGGGARASAAYITIENSTVNATSEGDGYSYSEKYCGGAGIGSGTAITFMEEAHDITIKGSTVNGSGIGGGGSAPINRAIATGSSSAYAIVIDNSTVDVTGNYGCAGIGGGSSGQGNDITIKNSNVRACGGHGGASGIGSGAPVILNADVDCNDISITDSTVQAYAGKGGGAGIGAGSSGEGTDIVLDGGNVFAEADYKQSPESHGGAIVNGYGANIIFPGLTPEGSAKIHDGTMYFADLCYKNDDFPGDLEINGGSINIEHVDGKVINSADTQVYKTTATLPGGAADAGKKVTLSIDGYSDYHDDAIWADDAGKIYLWLPENTSQTAQLTVEGYGGVSGGFPYAGEVKIDNSGVLTLTSGLQKPDLLVNCPNKEYDGIAVTPAVTSADLPVAEKARVTLTYKKRAEMSGNYQHVSAAPVDPGDYSVTASYPGNRNFTSASDTCLFTIRPKPGDDAFVIDCPSKAFDGTPLSPSVIQIPPGFGSFSYYFYTWNGSRWSSAKTDAPSAVGDYKVVAKTVDQHASNEVLVRIYQGASTSAYRIRLTCTLDGNLYAGQRILLADGGGVTYSLSDFVTAGVYENAAVPNGVYSVSVNGASIAKTVTVASADVDGTVEYYTVSFNADGGTPAPAQQIILKGGLLTDPGIVTKDGSDFTGWYTGGAAPKQWAFAEDTVQAATVLTAGWAVRAATIRVSPTVAAFPEKTSDYYIAPGAMTFTIANNGSVPITGFSVKSNTQDSKYQITSASQPIPTGGSASFNVQPKLGLPDGTYMETISVTTEPASADTVSVAVSFSVVPRESAISVNPAACDFATAAAGYLTPPAAQTFTLTYTGNFYALLKAPASEHYTITGLNSVLLSTANPTATFTVQPKASLPEGVYNETIPIDTMLGSTSTTVLTAFTVTAGRPAATVVRHPQSTAVSVGMPAIFTVTASGEPPLSYGWQVDSGTGWVTIASTEAQTATYEIPDTMYAMQGSRYRCAVYNRTQTVNVVFSEPAMLTMTLPIEIKPVNRFTQGAAIGLTAKAGNNANVRYSTSFASASIDGTPLTNGVEFDGEDGSILLHLRPDYLNTLDVGSHTLRITLTNGVFAETPIIVVPPSDAMFAGDIPNAGDSSMPLLWLLLLLFSIAGLAVSAADKHRSKKQL